MSSAPPATTEQVKKKWDDFSEVYADALEQFTFAGSSTLMAALVLPSAKRTLELACGAGLATSVMSNPPFSSATSRITAVDLSTAMVARTQARLAARKPLATVEVLQADMQDLPFPDATFDRVMANLCVFMAPDTPKALASIRRVMTPGGVFAFSLWGDAALSDWFTAFGTACTDCGVPNPVGGATTRSNFHLAALPEAVFTEMLEAAGFDNVLMWHQPIPMGNVDPAELVERQMTSRSPAAMAAIAGMPEEDLARVKRRQTELYTDILVKDRRPVGLDLLVVLARAC